MSKPPDNTVELSATLSLSEYTSGGHKGFWLWDETQEMNLAIRANSPVEALVEALHYYQKQLAKVEGELHDLDTKVNGFLSQFAEETEYDYNDE
jgi:hypothetical protein